ncbi:hypothetical protein BCR12_18935 [Limnothrix sp. P13C2]|nr:hypothetical protein BCR12_18935 [Limnothrix sp. P13C2]
MKELGSGDFDCLRIALADQHQLFTDSDKALIGSVFGIQWLGLFTYSFGAYELSMTQIDLGLRSGMTG